MKINEAAALTGLTVRALQYYDKIGLLPCPVRQNGYREYGQRELEQLEQILFFRELDFPLSEIADIMKSENYDRSGALSNQRQLLIMKKERLSRLIALIDSRMKGEHCMSFAEFDMKEIEEQRKKYAEETRERWGESTAYKQSEHKAASYGKADWERINAESAEIFKGFSAASAGDAGCAQAQELVARWREHISRYFYDCTNEILSGLGQMYTADERFMNSIDKFGSGTAEFMSRAIEIFCRSV